MCSYFKSQQTSQKLYHQVTNVAAVEPEHYMYIESKDVNEKLPFGRKTQDCELQMELERHLSKS